MRSNATFQAARDRAVPGLEARDRRLANPGFREGGFVVQDPAHALACRYAAIPAGTLVYDACAAPGGKAVMLERGGSRVVAGDARRERIGRLADTARRAGVAIRIAVADLLAAPFAPRSRPSSWTRPVPPRVPWRGIPTPGGA